jgi:sugar phosphate isomerase/epimerase
MSRNHSRRAFLTGGSLLPLGVAGATLGWGRGVAAAEPISRVGGPRLKLSLNAYSFSKALNDHLKGRNRGGGLKMTLLDLLDFCAKHDFDGIDPTGYFFPGYPQPPTDEYINQFKRRAFQLGLDITGTGVRNDFANPDADRRAADVQHVKEWIEVAAKLGAPVLRVFAGPQPEGYRWEEVAEWMVADLRQCAEFGGRRGVLVGVQNHGDMLKTATETLKIVEMVDSEWFGVIVDTGYFLTEDPYVDIAKVTPYAVNFQVKESPFGKESPIRTDLVRLIGIVRNCGYRGYLPIETLSLPGRPYDPLTLVPEFLAEVRAALDETERVSHRT